MMPNQILLELPWMEGRLWKPFLFGTALRGRKVAQKKHYIWNCPGWKKVCKKKTFFLELPWLEGRFWKHIFLGTAMDGRKVEKKNIFSEVPWIKKRIGYKHISLNCIGWKEGCVQQFYPQHWPYFTPTQSFTRLNMVYFHQTQLDPSGETLRANSSRQTLLDDDQGSCCCYPKGRLTQAKRHVKIVPTTSGLWMPRLRTPGST